MNCEMIGQLLLLQDSGEISEAQQQELAQHLNDCSACRQLKGDLVSLRKTFIIEASRYPGPSRHTLTVIRKAARRQHAPKPWIWAHPWPVALAAAASLALCLTTLRFSIMPRSIAHDTSGQVPLATEIIPLIALITGNEAGQLTMEGDETELTVLANELLRLQDMAVEWPGEKMDTPTLPEDYQPTTLLWHNIPGPQFERCG
ncbi:MAG: hypothetical protein WCI95_05225 [bacterium]